MPAHHALWVHGHSAKIEYPDRVDSIEYKGNSVRIQGRPSTRNWVHFAVPTPVIVDDRRMQPTGILFRYKNSGSGSVVAVHVYDGENQIATDESPWETASLTVDNSWTYFILGFDLTQRLSVEWGIGISIQIRFGRGGGEVEFEAAGCDFRFSNRIAPQRLRIYTKKAPMEFPYHSNLPIDLPSDAIERIRDHRNLPIDLPNDAIERILICIHGTGANAYLYLSNGLAAALEAIAGGVDLHALENTLIIAPQFIGDTDYYRQLPKNLLYWSSGWRASGSESIEQDLNGDGVPDSGTISSFTALDVLLERICRKSLFPNLKSVIISGHSNGGRFMSCYSAASRFEQEVATPRGIHVRYLVMGSGSYVYMDDIRYTFTNDTYLTAAHNDNWRHTIATLYDFGTVCTENPAPFNDWPLGLNMPVRDGKPVWPYPTEIGAEQIQNQFGSRDVHYLIGESDLLPSFEECPERVQGKDTLAKTLLYFWHLEQHYGADLNHHLHVIPDVGHSGFEEMTSPIGLDVIFGPIP